jgi:hypothetical protein
MNDHNAHIYTRSVVKVSRRLSVYGTADLSAIALLKLCYKYSCYSSEYAIIQRLDKIVSELQMMAGNDICMDFSNGNFLTDDISTPEPIDSTNTAPTVSANTVNIATGEDSYTFSLDDFILDFADAEGNGPGKIVLKSLPATGLIYDGEVALEGQTIFDPSLLVYDRNAAPAYQNTFNFSIFDDYVDGPEESIDTLMTIDVADAENLPAEVGDNTIYAGNRITTVLTLEMFTSQLAPPYNDPEGDLIDAIRIDEVSLANVGVYELNDVEVNEGDIITREDLNAGLFKHVGADTDSVSSDTFSFSARDEGSLIWVQ